MNASSWDALGEAEDPPRQYLPLKLFFLVLLVSWTVLANALIFLILYKFPKLRTLPNLLVGNLAFADFCLGLIVLPLSAIYSVTSHWSLGQFLCEFWLSLDILLCTASIWNLTIIGLDRFWAITKPVKYLEKRTPRSAGVMIAVVWVFSVCVCVAPFLGWRSISDIGNHAFDNETETYQCVHFEDLPSYTIYSATGSFFIPLFVMFFVYINIFCAFKKHRRRQIYRQKVIRKHLESTMLQDLSHVLPTSDEFAKDEEDDDDGSEDITSGKDSRSEDANKIQPTSGAQDCEVPTTDPYRNLRFTVEYAAARSPRAKGKSFKRVGSRRRAPNRAQRPVVTYDRIMRHKRRKELNLRTSLMKKPKAISAAKEKRGVKVLGIVLGCFAICWTPFFVMYISLTFCHTCTISKNVETFITWLGYANSAVNPIIYTVFSRDFQCALKKLVRGCCRPQNGQKHTKRPPMM